MSTVSLPYREFHANAFRGLRNVSLRDCTPINLLVGDNNSGKTSLLEAMVLAGDPFSPDQWRLATQVRGTWPLVDPPVKGVATSRLGPIEWMFPRAEGWEFGEISIDISGTCPLRFLRVLAQKVVGAPPSVALVAPGRIVEGVFQSESSSIDGLSLNVRASSDIDREQPRLPSGFKECQLVMWEQEGRSGAEPKPHPRVGFATPVSHRSDGYLAIRAGQLLREATKQATLSLVQCVDSKISDFWVGDPSIGSGDSLEDAKPQLHVDYESYGSVPIHSLGDGLRRVFHFAALLEEVGQGGVVLIDEIEVGLHTTALKSVFRWLCQACLSREIQLFVTTHSLEAIDALVAADPGDHISLHRIQSGRAQRYSGKLLRAARFELGQEVR